ncbi:MAG: hypothetical protein K9N34_01415 [Candidatus Marinimicrobia bacterium]|nr:hypothetical protein [Candidatus Neomarinimicrobiota bacterium]MCF7840025.1 hypothetical protein [Candidatus Neomarinimicrobiota bacterium]MCF7903471.1 hypothetical protein [Candidatus Neomarinimicrobiota bacterium]
MLNKFLHLYLPYGAIDLFLAVAIVSEIILMNYQLLWANLPVLMLGLWSFSRKLSEIQDVSDN